VLIRGHDDAAIALKQDGAHGAVNHHARRLEAKFNCLFLPERYSRPLQGVENIGKIKNARSKRGRFTVLLFLTPAPVCSLSAKIEKASRGFCFSYKLTIPKKFFLRNEIKICSK